MSRGRRAAALALVALMGAACSADQSDLRRGEPWEQVSRSPLPPDSDSLLLWSGDEVLVFGRSPVRFCAEGCENDDSYSYAYDPATDEWRRIAEPPAELFQARSRAFSGGQLFAVEHDAPGRILRYDLAADEWTFTDSPDLTQHDLVGAGDHLLAVRRCICLRRERPPYALDLATDEWRRLPQSPFEPARSQLVVPVDGRWFLFSPTAEDTTGVAMLRPDGDAWVELASGRDVELWHTSVVDDLVVFTYQPVPADSPITSPPHVSAFDTATRRWVELPPLDHPIVAAAPEVDGDTLHFGDMALDADDLTWSESVAPPDFGYERVWIGDRYVAFGGNGDTAFGPDGDVGFTWTWSR